MSSGVFFSIALGRDLAHRLGLSQPRFLLVFIFQIQRSGILFIIEFGPFALLTRMILWGSWSFLALSCCICLDFGLQRGRRDLHSKFRSGLSCFALRWNNLRFFFNFGLWLLLRSLNADARPLNQLWISLVFQLRFRTKLGHLDHRCRRRSFLNLVFHMIHIFVGCQIIRNIFHLAFRGVQFYSKQVEDWAIRGAGWLTYLLFLFAIIRS